MRADTAREEVLARIRAAGADVPADEDPSSDALPRAFRQADAMPPGALLELLVDRLTQYTVTVTRAPPEAAARIGGGILAGRGHRRLVIPADFPPALRPDGVELIADDGVDNAGLAAADGAITLCAAAIAQTGTLILDHTAGQGRRALSLLPDYQLCLVRAEQVVALVPEAVARMASSVRAGHPLTFISGPSATSDIELNRVEGVHGPRTLDVLLLA